MGKPLEIGQLGGRPDLAGRTVLVAEAASEVRWSIVGLLRDAGARVTESRDGLEALELARSQPPDLIVANATMPGLDGLGLCAAVRREPSLQGVTVVLRSDGQPPHAIWEPDARSGPLVEGLLAALGRSRSEQRPKSASSPDAAAPESTAPAAVPDSESAMDAAEREDLRAQSTVAMYREPANRAPGSPQPVWRLRGSRTAHADSRVSGFGWELQVMSRGLGLGFTVLLSAVVALITWRVVVSIDATNAPTGSNVTARTPPTEEPARTAVAVPEPAVETPARPRRGLEAFSGDLLPTIDPLLGAAPGEGALELRGPSHMRAWIDGVDQGLLPMHIALPEGTHRVRYQRGDRSTVRFYYVKSGATRVLSVVARPGGFVDAR